jgi:hypothetical protein
MTLAPIDGLTPAPEHRELLARWLQEWQLFLALADETSAEDASVPALTLDRPPHSPAVERGDIRLIHPSIEPVDVRYVAVVDQDDAEDWLVIPFGRLSEPATTEEVRTDRNSPTLRVLCPWNRFSVTTTALQRCWLVDRLTDQEAGWTGSALPPERTGPPLRHPLDPRWDYLEMESEFRQRVCSKRRTQVVYDIISSTELRKAAEDQAPYGSENGSAENEGQDNNA